MIIDYPDGSHETVAARLEGGVIAYGQAWVPSILVDEPKQCGLKSDFFDAALNEGKQRCGEVEADPDEPAFSGFRWTLTGTEADACLAKLAQWIRVLGASFNPEISGESYLYEGLLRLLSDAEAAQVCPRSAMLDDLPGRSSLSCCAATGYAGWRERDLSNTGTQLANRSRTAAIECFSTTP